MKKRSSIKINYLYNLVYTLLNTALPLLTAPYLARVVGAEGVGTYAYYHAYAHFFYIVAKLGLNNYGTRKISKCRTEDELSETFSSIYYQQLITSTIANITYWLFCTTIMKKNSIHAYIMSIIVLASFFDIDWLFSGLEQFKTISKKNIFVKTLSVILIFLLVKKKEDLWKYSLLMSLSMFFGYSSMWLSLKRIVKFRKIELSSILSHIKPNLKLVIPVFSISIYRQLDKIMLGSMSNLLETGYYENAEKVIYALCGFITAFGTIMMPRISNMISRGKERESSKYMVYSMQFMMSLMFAMSAGIMAVSNNLSVVLFGPEFFASGKLMAFLSITLPLIGWSNIIRSQYVIPKGEDNIYISTVVIGAIIDICVNLVFIPKYAAFGAVLGTIFAEGSIPITQWLLLRKRINYLNIFKKTIFAPIIGLFIYVSASLIGKSAVNFTKILFFQIIVGIMVYIFSTVMYFVFFEKEVIIKLKSRKSE